MEKLESEVDKYVSQKDFEGLNFVEFRKALLAIDLKLTEFDACLENSVSDCYYETRRLKDQLEEMRPQQKRLEEVLDTTKEVKLPFKFESTLNTFTIRLLDLGFVEALSDALEGKPKVEKKLESFSPTKIRQLSGREQLGQDEVGTLMRRNSVQSMTERFNTSTAFSKTKRDMPSLRLTNVSPPNVLDQPMDSYDLRRSAVLPIGRKSTIDSIRKVDEPIQPNDVCLNNCENIYDIGRRTSSYKSFGFGAIIARPEIDSGSVLTEEPTQTPSSKKFIGATSTTNLIFKKSTGGSISRKPSVVSATPSTAGSTTKFPKYYSSVITLTNDTGVVCGQVIDELRFRTILTSLKVVPRNVKIVEMVNNVFKINPIPMLKSAFESKLWYVLQIEIPKNTMMANLVYTKRDLEALANFNVVLIN